jgi:metal-responsive CopG/Arc/MetJ family transcriptional regulator
MPRPSPKKAPAKATAPARPSVTLRLPRELLEQIEALAQREERPRSKVIEFACREYVQNHQRRPATA